MLMNKIENKFKKIQIESIYLRFKIVGYNIK